MANYYPPVAFAFAVSVAGAPGPVDASFSEVSGLDVEREVEEVKEGGENRFTHRLPGRARMQNLVLKRGVMVAESALFSWCKTSLEADLSTPLTTRTVTVSLQDEKARPLMAWSFAGAWPVKWTVDSFRASEAQVAIETLEFAYQTLTRTVERPMPQTGAFTGG